MIVRRYTRVEGDGWHKRTETTSEISDDYIRNTMGIIPDGKPLDVIIGEFRQYLAGIGENDDEFGFGLIDSMADFAIVQDSSCSTDYFIRYADSREVTLSWKITGR